MNILLKNYTAVLWKSFKLKAKFPIIILDMLKHSKSLIKYFDRYFFVMLTYFDFFHPGCCMSKYGCKYHACSMLNKIKNHHQGRWSGHLRCHLLQCFLRTVCDYYVDYFGLRAAFEIKT